MLRNHMAGFLALIVVLYAPYAPATAQEAPAPSQQSENRTSPSAQPKDEKDILEVPIGGKVDRKKPVEDIDDAYIDLGNGVVISFGEWLRRKFAPDDFNDPVQSRIKTGALGRSWLGGRVPGMEWWRANRPIEAFLSNRYKNRSFLSLAKEFNYDPDWRTPGMETRRGIYAEASPLTQYVSAADEELGVIDFSGGPKLLSILTDSKIDVTW